MKRFCALLVVLGARALLDSAGAQPSDLHTCLSDPPDCEEVGGPLTVTGCSRLFTSYYGRVAWYPLKCVGPITVAVETFASWQHTLPLYVEVVPLKDPNNGPCDNAAGNVVLMAWGDFNNLCGSWQTAGPIDIASVVPLGGLYAIRVHFLGRSGPGGDTSPPMDCIQVTAHPVTSGLLPATWGGLKALYK